MANDEIRVRLVGDSSDLQRALDDSRRKAIGFKGALGDVAKTAGGFLAANALSAGLSAVSTEFNRSVDAASNLEQALGGTAAVFGDNRTVIDSWAQTSAQSVGLSEAAFREGTTQIGASLKRMTGDVDFAAAGSVRLTQIGADAAAMFGGTTKDAVHALGRAFAGEADPAERFGFDLRTTTVQAFAAEKGITNLKTGSAEYAQVLLELVEAQAKETGALGQFGREADTTVGQLQRMNAEMEDLRAKNGEALTPIKLNIEKLKSFGLETLNAAAEVDTLGEVLRFLSTGSLPKTSEETKRTEKSLQAASDRMAGLANASFNAKKPVDNAAEAVEGMGDEAETTEERIDRLINKLRAMVDPTFALVDAENEFEAALDDARQAAKENGETLDKHTEKGRANREALKNIAESTFDLIEAQARNGKSTDTLRNTTERGRKEFIRQAMQLGATREEAVKLADKYGLIPKKVETTIRTPGMDKAREDVSKLNNALQGLPNVARIEFKTTGSDGLGLFGLGSFGGGLMGISASSAVGRAYTSMGRPGDVISGFRPGARTLSGNLSYHAQGRALDITPEMGIALAIRQRFKGRTRELITPWPWLNVLNGSNYRYSDAVQAQHDGRTNVRHIHWAMAEGGYGTVTKPTVFLAGERGREDFAFVPHSKGGMRGGDVHFHFHITAGMLVHQANLERDLATVFRRFIRTNGGVAALGRM